MRAVRRREGDPRRGDVIRLFARQHDGSDDAEVRVAGHGVNEVTNGIRGKHRVAIQQQDVLGARGKRVADADIAAARKAAVAT